MIWEKWRVVTAIKLWFLTTKYMYLFTCALYGFVDEIACGLIVVYHNAFAYGLRAFSSRRHFDLSTSSKNRGCETLQEPRVIC